MDSIQKYLAELQAIGQLPSLAAGPSEFGNGWVFNEALLNLPPGARQEGLTMADRQIDPWALGIVGDTGMTPAEFGQRYGIATRVASENGGNANYRYLVDTQANNKILGQESNFDRGFDVIKDLVLPAAAIWGGGALLGSALGGGAAAAGGGGATAGGGAAASSAGAAGTLGATYIPTAIAPIASAPITGGLGAAAATLPEFAAIGGSLGGIGAVAPTLGASYIPTAISPIASAPITGGMAASAAALPEFATLGSLGGLGSAAAVGGDATKAALLGDTGYGAGMTGAQTGAYDSVLGATGSKGLASAAANLPGLSTVGNIASSLGGVGNLASLAGGLLGASDAGKATTATSQNQIDPRMAQYLYGSGFGDTNSILGAAQQQFLQNRTGLNALQQQGLDLQKNLLTSPEYTQGFNQMRSAASGLLGSQVAGNPFTSGQASLQSSPLLGPSSQMAGFNPGSIQQLIAAGRGLLG